MINSSLKAILIVLLCITMQYQIHLLLYEYRNGATTELFYQLEPNSDLPSTIELLANMAGLCGMWLRGQLFTSVM